MSVKRQKYKAHEVQRVLQELSAHNLEIGIMDGNRYPSPKDGGDAGPYVAEVAAIQEYGTKRIPARPFFRPTIAEKTPDWRGLIMRAALASANNGNSVVPMLEVIADSAAADVFEYVSRLDSPELKPSTVKARQKRNNTSTKPLIDSGYMIDQIKGRVVKK